MSNATQHSRQSGDSQRRRSRGGRNRNQQQDNRRSGDRDSRESRDSHEGRSNSGRAEEFRPQSPRSPRMTTPVKLSWWQKLLKAIGLYKEPKPPSRGERKPEGAKPPLEARPAKSNTRNARTSEGPGAEGGDGPAPRAARSGERSRGGDRSTVESPRVYVGNLSYEVSEQDLQELFKGIGGVRNVEIVYNRSTHRSKGYGFVEMLHMDEAVRAVEVLHDQPFMGRKLTVSGAKSKGQDEREEREERPERPERPERAQRPVVVAPRPASTVMVAAAEPVIQTIVETVPEAAGEEFPVGDDFVVEETPAVAEVEAETQAGPVNETAVDTAVEAPDDAPVQTETKNEGS